MDYRCDKCGHQWSEADPLLDAEQAARIYRVTRDTIYWMVKHGRIPAEVVYRSGDRVWFRRRRFLQWLEEGEDAGAHTGVKGNGSGKRS